MKKTLLILCTLFLVPSYISAGITTYTFTSYQWASKVGSTVCDGITDGWISDKDAYNESYTAGRYDAQGLPYSWGVDVKKSTTGAGATSVLSFTEVRRITFNFCQNSSKGAGTIYVQVGENEPQSINVSKPADGRGQYNRDSVISLTTPQSGKIKFWVECSENAIYINTITIRSASGGSSVFTMDTYQLVTDINQLQDSDQVIFGVAQEGCNYIMGYFDESVSSNNIHAIKGSYTADRSQVEPDDRAIYTLRITELNGSTAYVFRDELRYEEAYLVASGGKTKNRLAVWDRLVDENTYGNYGYWSISIGTSGEALITNLGNSLANIIQYNASNSPTLFACYATQSQTPVCLYRRVEALGDVEAIVAPMVNFGTTIQEAGARTIQVNANRLTADICATLLDGSVFSLSTPLLDRDGDELTVSFSATASGRYSDTLILTSGTIEERVPVLLNRIAPMPIAEAVTQEDYTTVYLTDVVVTKKYDNYIYIRDASGSMLIFDRGDGTTGKRYGADLKAGDPLSGVTGRMLNYYGVPELSPIQAWSVGTNNGVEPEPAPAVIDSANVCRYLLLDSAVISGTTLTYKGQAYALTNKFNLPSFIENEPTKTTVIVSYDWDILTLYPVSQERYPVTGLTNTLPSPARGRVVLRNGVLYIITEQGVYTLTGEQVWTF